MLWDSLKDCLKDSIRKIRKGDLTTGDHNSGWHFCKYPFYSDEDEGQMESDYVEIRLAEVIYSLAECKFRKGQVDEAAELLNSVRKRNHPQRKLVAYLMLPRDRFNLPKRSYSTNGDVNFLQRVAVV